MSTGKIGKILLVQKSERKSESEPVVVENSGESGTTILDPFMVRGLPSGEAISGHLDGVDDEGRVNFRPEGSGKRFQVAVGIPLSDDEVVKAARLGRRALVLPTADKHPRLVLISLLRERVSVNARDANPGELKVKLDGETISLTARTQIELVCGKSRILLHANGRIELSGSYLLSRSRGPVKLKGATVEIN